MAAYSILEAKSNFDALIDQASKGEEVVIADRGGPMLKLVSVQQGVKHIPTRTYRRAGQNLAGWAEVPDSINEPLPEEIQTALGMLD